MHCQYCGKEVWVFRGMFDRDFCGPSHRRMFADRIRRALDEAPKGPPAGIAPFARRLFPMAYPAKPRPLRVAGVHRSALTWPAAACLALPAAGAGAFYRWNGRAVSPASCPPSTLGFRAAGPALRSPFAAALAIRRTLPDLAGACIYAAPPPGPRGISPRVCAVPPISQLAATTLDVELSAAPPAWAPGKAPPPFDALPNAPVALASQPVAPLALECTARAVAVMALCGPCAPSLGTVRLESAGLVPTPPRPHSGLTRPAMQARPECAFPRAAAPPVPPLIEGFPEASATFADVMPLCHGAAVSPVTCTVGPRPSNAARPRLDVQPPPVALRMPPRAETTVQILPAPPPHVVQPRQPACEPLRALHPMEHRMEVVMRATVELAGAVPMAPMPRRGGADLHTCPARQECRTPERLPGADRIAFHGDWLEEFASRPRPRKARARVFTMHQYQALAATVLLAAILPFVFSGAQLPRTVLDMEEDFSAGLERWEGKKSAWRIDPKGFVRPGELALFTPSLRLADYRLEFRALLETRTLGWAFRASDAGNYHGIVFRRQRSGMVAVERFSVIDGKRQAATPLAVAQLSGKTPFQTMLAAQGDQFALWIDGRQVAQWQDGRLPQGGIGLFGDLGGRSRIYRVRLAAEDGKVAGLRRFLPAHTQAEPGKDHRNGRVEFQ